MAKKALHKSTSQQANAITLILRRENVFIKALAGTGKTTTLIEAVAQLIEAGVRNGLICAFNVKIRDELIAKLRRRLGRDHEAFGWEVRTLNSLGHSTLIANGYGKRGKLTLDPRKNNLIISEAMREPAVKAIVKAALTKEGRAFLASSGEHAFEAILVETLRAAKLYGITSNGMNSKSLEVLLYVALMQSNFPENLLLPTADLARVMERCLLFNLTLAREQAVIDYDDQVYLATKHCSHPGRVWGTVVADEVQDLSWANHTQLTRACSQQLILAGDIFQCIYKTLKAASIEALNDTIEKRKMKVVLLDRSFRCAQSICEKQVASGLLESFEPVLRDRAPLGDIRMPFFQADSLDDRAYWRLNKLMASDLNGTRTMVLAGFNAGLVEFASIMWSAKRSLLTPERMFYFGQRIPKAVWRRAEAINFGHTKPDSLLIAACSLFLRVSHLRVEEAEKLFNELVDSEPSDSKLMLATVHSIKGLERDKVIIVNPHQLPDENVVYVAQTRARTELLSAYTSWYSGSGSINKLLAVYTPWVKAPVPPKGSVAMKQALAEVPLAFRVGKSIAHKRFASSCTTPNMVTKPSDEARQQADVSSSAKRKKRKDDAERKRDEKKARKKNAGGGPGRDDLRGVGLGASEWAKPKQGAPAGNRLRGKHDAKPNLVDQSPRKRRKKRPAASARRRAG